MHRAACALWTLIAAVAIAVTVGAPGTAQAQSWIPFDPSQPAPVNQPSSEGGMSMATMASPLIPSGVAVGRTAGSFGVLPSGSANYTIPIWTPPGIAGVSPSLALSYSSSAGDGWYGVGWNLAGLSSITRCAKTYGQDGLSANILLTIADLYCLDGKKLRSFAGTTYGADGAEYQTEVADFSLVISHGSTSGTGPAWFEVHGKNGLIYQYGNTTDSALLATGTTTVLMWALNRVSDRFGNHWDVTYTNDTTNQVLRPATITYTTPGTTSGGVQQTPNYQVAISYVSRSGAIPTGFNAGTQFIEPYLVNTISVNAWNGSAYAAARTYSLSYPSGPTTSRRQLTSIQECSSTQCFPATNTSYQSGTSGWSAGSAASAYSSTLWTAFAVDLNGDGIDDLVYEDKATLHWYYLLGQASGGFQGPWDTGLSFTTTAMVPIDYFANGRMDLMIQNSSGNWRVLAFTSPGGTFAVTDTSIPAVWPVIVGDVDGDGRDDIIYAVSSGTANWGTPDYLYYRLNSANGFGAQTQLAQIGYAGCNTICTKLTSRPFGQYSLYDSRVRRADVNGDGRLDFLVNLANCTLNGTKCQSTTYTWQLFVSDAGSVQYDALDVLQYGAYGSGSVPPLFGDFNGDGCTDVAFDQGGHWYIQYGTCLRSGAAYALSAAVNTGIAVHGIYAVAVDWDGDGYDDIVEPSATSGGYLGYLHSTGTSFSPWASTGIAYSNADTGVNAIVVADINGDGLYDLIYPSGASDAITVFTHSGATVTPDRATSFTDGFGVNYSPTYKQLTNSSVYTKGSGAAYPEQDVQNARTVVSAYSASDGIGGTYTVTESYTQARVNLPRRESEGFGSVRAVDSRDGLYRYQYFGQLFPLTGMVSEQKVLQSNGSTPISDVTNTLASQTLDATYKRYFPYVSQSVASGYEFGGSLNGTLITQTTTSYTYGGANGYTYGNVSQVASSTIDEDPNSPWHGDTYTDTVNITPYEVGGTGSTGWCIHLPSQVAETRSAPTGSPTSLTHTTSYTVNSNSECEVDSQTVEPSSSTDKVVTAYAYTDGCGNINSVSVTGQTPAGSAMAARTTTLAYGSHCIAPETVTNALSQATSVGYRYDLGLRTSATDPNNLTTSWTYNDIGQKTLEQRPDGTQTGFAPVGCTSPPCWGDANLRFYVQRNENDNTGGHSTYWHTVQYFDQFGRLKYDEPVESNGATITTFLTYDNLGRLIGRTNPYGNGFLSYTTTTVYDALNRPTQQYRPISSTNSTLEYTNYTYQGRTATIQDPKGYTTTRKSDATGQLLRLVDPDGTSTTYYAYSPFGALASIQDPAGNQTTRSYDSLGYLLTASSDPDRGSWTYQYDSLGDLINLRDAKTSAPNWTQQLTYDALGRPLTRVETEGTTTWTWGTVAANHEIGRLTQLSGLGDTEAYTFDAYGRPASRTQTWNSTNYVVGYAYNTLGKLDTLTYPSTPLSANAFAVKYGYTNGYLSSLQNYTGGTAGTTFWQLTAGGVNMDPWGHVVDETLGTTTAVRIQSAFDAVTSWVNTREVGSGGSGNNLQNLAYQWDLNGNLSQRQDLKQALTEAFNYDNLNRLSTSTLNGTQNLSVTIDNTGNITQRVEAGVTYPYTYDTTHKHAVDTVGTGGNQTTSAYDANGNMSTRNGYSLSWSTANLPTTINGPNGVSATFSYGPDRQRKQQTAYYASAEGDNGTETTIYVAGIFEVETTPAQTHYKHFVQVPGGTQIIYDLQSVSGTQVTYVTADHLGSGNLLINSAGTTQINESYSAYGYRRSSNWSGPLSTSSGDYTTISSTTRRGYTDALHEMLDNLNLIHMNGRVQDPVIGRFLSPDAVVATIGSSQSLNPYGYVSNNPLSLVDPTGLEELGPTVINNNWEQTPDVAPNPPGNPGSIPDCIGCQIDVCVGCNSPPPPLPSLPTLTPWVPLVLLTRDNSGRGQAGGKSGSSQPAKQSTTQAQGTPCPSALRTAGQNQAAVNRALSNWNTISSAAAANGIDPALLAAIGVRESGFRNVWQSGGGMGAGVFQIDLGANPNVTAAQAFNVPFAANYAAGMLASNSAYLGATFPNLTSAQLLQATAASYNFGVGNISGNPATIDVGSTGNNYGSNVVGLMSCFNH